MWIDPLTDQFVVIPFGLRHIPDKRHRPVHARLITEDMQLSAARARRTTLLTRAINAVSPIARKLLQPAKISTEILE
jgi:hypothetical protein